MNKNLFIFLGLTVINGCAVRQPTYQNNYVNNSIPAVQYDSGYRAGCNKAIYSYGGETYNGGYCYGKKKGSGVATYTYPPSKYDGVFDNDLRNGYGVYTWTKSGDTYSGNWKDGKQNGFGTYTWGQDGSYEVGNWVNANQEGEHRLYYKNGTLYANRSYRNGVLISTSVVGSQQVSPQKAYSDPNAKIQKCKRLGLVEGSEDYQLCLKSVKN
jgi:hypothetical protein